MNRTMFDADEPIRAGFFNVWPNGYGGRWNDREGANVVLASHWLREENRPRYRIKVTPKPRPDPLASAFKRRCPRCGATEAALHVWGCKGVGP